MRVFDLNALLKVISRLISSRARQQLSLGPQPLVAAKLWGPISVRLQPSEPAHSASQTQLTAPAYWEHALCANKLVIPTGVFGHRAILIFFGDRDEHFILHMQYTLVGDVRGYMQVVTVNRGKQLKSDPAYVNGSSTEVNQLDYFIFCGYRPWNQVVGNCSFNWGIVSGFALRYLYLKCQFNLRM